MALASGVQSSPGGGSSDDLFAIPIFPLNAISKKQSCVSHSTPEAEIVAADLAIRTEGLPARTTYLSVSICLIMLLLILNDNNTNNNNTES